MKAVVLRENGGRNKLVYESNYPVPKIKSNEALIEVKATSVNRVDILIRNGYPGLKIKFPHILGGDITGVIKAIGSDVKNFKKGERIISWPIVSESDDEWSRKGRPALSPDWKYFGMNTPGSYSEFTVVPESSLIKLPENVSFEDAACLPVAGLTAYHALTGVAKLDREESFFIWGGTSGLGNIAVQIAKLVGAKIFATAGSKKKMEKLKELGVDYVFNHFEDTKIHEKVLDITLGRGIDVIIDYVGPATFDRSFNMMKKGGRLVLCGILSGREATLNIHTTYLKHLSLFGTYLGEKNELEELVNLVSLGAVKPLVHRIFELEDIQDAHKLIEEGKAIGKIVILP